MQISIQEHYENYIINKVRGGQFSESRNIANKEKLLGHSTSFLHALNGYNSLINLQKSHKRRFIDVSVYFLKTKTPSILRFLVIEILGANFNRYASK